MQTHVQARRQTESHPPQPARGRAAPGPQQGKMAHIAAQLNARKAGSAQSSQPVVQRVLEFDEDTAYLGDPSIDIPSYRQTLAAAHAMKPIVRVVAGIPDVGAAQYERDRSDPEKAAGKITIKPLKKKDIANKSTRYYDRLIEMSHETRHAIDSLASGPGRLRIPSNATETIYSEWNAFATQSAVAAQVPKGRLSEKYLKSIAAFADETAFMSPLSGMVNTTALYMKIYGLTDDVSNAEARKFMTKNRAKVADSIHLFRNLSVRQVPLADVQNFRPNGIAPTDWSRDVGGSGFSAETLVVTILLAVILMWLARRFRMR